MSVDLIAEQTLLWTEIAAIGQIAGAAATLSAVLLSLWIVLSDRSARLSARIGLRIIVPMPPQLAKEVVAFNLTNAGQRSVRVTSVGWQVGHLKRWWLPYLPVEFQARMAVQVEGNDRSSARLPNDLTPGQDITVFVDCALFDSDRHDLFDGKISLLGKTFRPSIYGWISVVGAKTIVQRVEPGLAAFLRFGTLSDSVQKLNAGRRTLL